jgi:hypothetical protein
MSRRPYEEFRRLVEQEGGSVVFEKAGYPKGGAFVITLRGKRKVFRSQGPAVFPQMDYFYVPRLNKEHTRTLIPGALEKLLEIFETDFDPQENLPPRAFFQGPPAAGVPQSSIPMLPPEVPVVLPPFEAAAEYVARVKASRGLPERNMEDLVKELLVRLGHPPAAVVFQMGHIDVLVQDTDGKPRFVIEVKRFLLSRVDRDSALRQGFDYATRNGAPFVLITDADAYEIYDRRAGLDHASMLQASFRLTALKETDLSGLALLKP